MKTLRWIQNILLSTCLILSTVAPTICTAVCTHSCCGPTKQVTDCCAAGISDHKASRPEPGCLTCTVEDHQEPVILTGKPVELDSLGPSLPLQIPPDSAIAVRADISVPDAILRAPWPPGNLGSRAPPVL